MENILIRTVQADDLNTIYRYVCLLEGMEFDKQVFTANFLQNIRNENYIYLLAEIDNKVAGYLSCHGQILLHHNRWVYEIQEMFTDAAYRGKTIGEKLLDALYERLQNVDFDTLEVTSNVKRVDAHRFYLKNGFQQTHLKFTKHHTPR